MIPERLRRACHEVLEDRATRFLRRAGYARDDALDEPAVARGAVSAAAAAPPAATALVRARAPATDAVRAAAIRGSWIEALPEASEDPWDPVHRWVRVRVPADGNCQFTAVATAVAALSAVHALRSEETRAPSWGEDIGFWDLAGLEDPWAPTSPARLVRRGHVLRAEALGWLRAEDAPAGIAGFEGQTRGRMLELVTGQTPEDLRASLARLVHPTVWGSELTAMALAEVLGLRLRVWRTEPRTNRVPPGTEPLAVYGDSSAASAFLDICWSGRIVGDAERDAHYDALVPVWWFLCWLAL